MIHADVKNVKITKSVLSSTKFDQIPAICSGYLCDFMRFFFCKSFIIGGIAHIQYFTMKIVTANLQNIVFKIS